MMQQHIVNEEGNKAPTEAEEKHFFSALKKRFDFGQIWRPIRGAKPEAKKLEPKNSKQMTTTPSVYFKTPLVVYKEKDQNDYFKTPLVVYNEKEQNDVTCTYCLAGTLPSHQPSVWTKCKDNSDLNNTYEGKEFNNFARMDQTPYTDEESYYFNQNQTANMWLEPNGSDEEYFTQEFSGTSSNNLYMNLTSYSDDGDFYNQTTYFSANENQVDSVWLEPILVGFWFNNTLYF